MSNSSVPLGKDIAAILIGALVLLGLYLTSLYSYLLFHSLIEIFSIVVACAIFMLAWNARRFLEGEYYLLFIGVAYLFVAGLDLLHTLAYQGMGVFQGFDANLPTQLWIASRYVMSISLLVAPLMLDRKPKIHLRAGRLRRGDRPLAWLHFLLARFPRLLRRRSRADPLQEDQRIRHLADPFSRHSFAYPAPG